MSLENPFSLLRHVHPRAFGRIVFFGGGDSSDGGGGSDDKPAQRSQADIQKDINQALKDSGGAWTSELNDLVAEREAAKAGGGATSAPAAVSAAPAGTSGFTFGSTPVGSLPAAKTTTTTAAAAPATAYSFGSTPVGSLPAAEKPATSYTFGSTPVGSLPSAPTTTTRDRDDRAPAGTYVPSAPATTTTSTSGGTSSGRGTVQATAPSTTTTTPATTTTTPAQVTREPEPYSSPVIDLGVINIAPEPDYSYDPYAESLQSWFNEMGSDTSAPVVDPVAEARERDRAAAAEAAAEAEKLLAEIAARDAQRLQEALAASAAQLRDQYVATGIRPGATSAAVDPFGSTPLGQIGNIMNVGYGVGQVDPALAAEINRSQITEDQYRQAVANYQPDLGLGALTASGVGLLGQLVGEAGMAATDRSIAPVGYGVGQVDPALAAAVDQRMATELGYIPSNLPQSELYGTFADLAEAGDVLRSRAISNAPRAGQEALSQPIWGLDEEGNITFNTDAFLAKGATSVVPTVAGLGGAPLGYSGLAATGAGLTAGEVALEARQQAEAAALAAGYTPEQAAVIGQEAANRAAGPGAVVGGVSNVVFGPFLPAGSPVRNIIGGAAEEALTEGVLEQTISNIAAETAMGRPVSDLPLYGVAASPDEATLGAAGGSLLAGIGSIPPGTTAAVSPVSVAPSGPAPFTPAAPGPAPFTPGAGPAATMTVEGTATDVTPGFRPTGPTVGQIAQTPPGLLSAYQQAAESLGAAGVRNIGGAPAPGMMDVAAATEIINNEIAETGALSLRTAQNLENATGLGMESIRDIAESAPNVGVPRDNLITDVVTGTGGGGQIQVTANRDGSYTLRNLTTGNPQHVATVEAGQNLDEAIKVFDEVTTVGSPEAITVDTAGIASLPPTDPRLNIPPGALPAAETTPAAEPTTALVPSGPATGVTTTTRRVRATPAETAEIIEFTPTEDVIEGTAVEIAGQIPGTVATTTTPAVTTVETTTTPTTLPPTSTVVPDEEEEFVTVDVEEEGPAPGGGDEEGVEVELPPEMQETDEEEEEEAPFECPEGYTAVKMAGRWVCQKTETSMVGRPTIGTRPYLSRVGFAGPSPRPQQLTTRTRTVTAAE